MSWLLSFVVALLAGAVGLVLAAFVSILVVDWYRISGFEGGSGYLVVFNALLGGVAGLIVGLVTARVVARGAHPGFLKAAGASLGIVLVIAATAAVAARMLADIPPELDGQRLLLAVELRWPASGAQAPDKLGGAGILTLGSVTAGRMRRASRDGALWLSDATRVDGRFVVPGAVEIFTNRGSRTLEAGVGDTTLAGFLVPLAGSPQPEHLAWSEWLPRAKPGSPPLPDQFTYRYRVVRVGEPVRTTTEGPFTIGTAVSAFYRGHGTEEFSAESRFRITYGGQPVAGLGDVRAAAVVAGDPTALLVDSVSESGDMSCLLVVDDAGRARVEPVASGGALGAAMPVTSDPLVLRDAQSLVQPSGWLNRKTFRSPGLYLLNDVVFDTRTRTAQRVTEDTSFSTHAGVPPLGVSPDGRTMLRFGYADGSTERPALLAVRIGPGAAYTLPVDRARMRYGVEAELDPAWVLHHFEWQKDADGTDRLVERKTFAPLPHRGRLSVESDNANYYTLASAGIELRAALVAFLVAEFGAVVVEGGDPQTYTHKVRVGDQVVHVSAGGSPAHVTVSMEYGVADTSIVARIGQRFDAALATGKYDALFGK